MLLLTTFVATRWLWLKITGPLLTLRGSCKPCVEEFVRSPLVSLHPIVSPGDESLVYTGDYNTTPDRHLGAATIECLKPDLLISESTYATTIRDSKRVREREFLQQVAQTNLHAHRLVGSP